jgi:hypothetical protein
VRIGIESWSDDVSENAGFGAAAFLPPGVLRQQAIEDRQEAREAREAQRAREAAAEQAHDRAVAAFMAGAAARGEDVPAMAAAAGNIGRTLAEVLSGATSELADRIPAGERGPRDYELLGAGEPVIHASRSSGWPSTVYEVDSLLRRASGLHGDLQAARARRDYPAALEAARAKSEAGGQHTYTDGPGHEAGRGITGYGEISR